MTMRNATGVWKEFAEQYFLYNYLERIELKL